jgi:PEP-CTERM motif
MNQTALASFYRTAIFIVAAISGAPAVADVPLPPATFIFDVTQGNTVVSGCTSFGGAAAGGSCGSESSGPGYALTSGGIGTASYVPATPGGIPLGTGTVADAVSNWTSGKSVLSTSLISYSFEASGPSSVSYIPVDVLSTALLSVAGNSTAEVSLVIRGEGPANTPAPLLDLLAFCAYGTCVSDWGTPGSQLTSLLCVANGDSYSITISAITTAGKGQYGPTDAASALIDPVIKLDPPYPTSCPVPVDPSQIRITTSAGTSTGVSVPEPSGVSLAALGALGLCLFSRRRRALLLATR